MTRADSVHSTPPLNTSSRRIFLAQAAVAVAGGAALGAALPLPESALASGQVPDPIFALMESHRSAYAAWSAAVDIECRLEEDIPSDLSRTWITVWDDAVIETDAPRWIDSQTRSMQALDKMRDLAWELAVVPATTLAGIVALTAYVAVCEEQHDLTAWPQPAVGRDTWPIVFHRNLASALAAMVDGGRA